MSGTEEWHCRIDTLEELEFRRYVVHDLRILQEAVSKSPQCEGGHGSTTVSIDDYLKLRGERDIELAAKNALLDEIAQMRTQHEFEKIQLEKKCEDMLAAKDEVQRKASDDSQNALAHAAEGNAKLHKQLHDAKDLLQLYRKYKACEHYLTSPISMAVGFVVSSFIKRTFNNINNQSRFVDFICSALMSSSLGKVHDYLMNMWRLDSEDLVEQQSEDQKRKFYRNEQLTFENEDLRSSQYLLKSENAKLRGEVVQQRIKAAAAESQLDPVLRTASHTDLVLQIGRLTAKNEALESKVDTERHLHSHVDTQMQGTNERIRSVADVVEVGFEQTQRGFQQVHQNVCSLATATRQTNQNICSLATATAIGFQQNSQNMNSLAAAIQQTNQNTRCLIDTASATSGMLQDATTVARAALEQPRMQVINQHHQDNSLHLHASYSPATDRSSHVNLDLHDGRQFHDNRQLTDITRTTHMPFSSLGLSLLGGPSFDSGPGINVGNVQIDSVMPAR